MSETPLNKPTYDVLAVGNAIVDILSNESEAFLVENNLVKGAMTLVDQDQSAALYAKMSDTIKQSGGSAANTVAGIASFGGKCAYIGKVSDDEFGRAFRKGMTDIGVDHLTGFAATDVPTASCLVNVTPDGQRTMSTHLGVSTDLTQDDLDEQKIKSAKVVYLEGYLFDKLSAKLAFKTAAKMAHEAGRKVALTLSDGFCVDRHRDAFQELVDGHIDILFANEDEIKSLYETDSLNEVIEIVQEKCEIVAITRSAKGAVIFVDGQRYEVKADPVDAVVDTTGAGDLFAAGFLYGYTHGMSPTQCAQLGASAAAEVISHMGARPEKDLSEILAA